MSRQTGPSARSLARCLGVPVVALACCGLAQPPERSQEVEVPGLGIMLKAGWQVLFHDRCRFAVPVFWHADPDEAFARAPDGSSISIQMQKTTKNWSAHKTDIRRMYAGAKVYDDSSRRLWFAIDDGSRVQHYIAVVDATNVCVGWLEMRSGSTAPDLVKRIADSIGPAPETWPAEEK